MSDPRVGAVILTYNRADEAARTVQRMLALPERPRVVVVDNASPDDTAATLRERFPHAIDVMRLARNEGAAGRNVGVARLDRPYVALCDDDTWWAPGSLGAAADLLDANPRLACVTARVLVGHDQREDPTSTAMAASPLPRVRGLSLTPILGLLAGAAVVRRTAFLEVGGFEPRLFLGGEEHLLALDLAARGWYLAYAPRLVVHHYPSPRRDARARRRLIARNLLWIAWLRRPRAVTVRITARAAWYALRDVEAARGFVAAFAGLPWALTHRRVVPPAVETALVALETLPPHVAPQAAATILLPPRAGGAR